VLNGRIYVVGGLYTPADRQGEEKPQTEPSACVDVYDPIADSWSRAADLPSGRVKPAVAAVGQRLFVLGGRDMDPGENTRSILACDPACDTSWTEVGEMPVGFRHSSACVVDGMVYVTGGWTPEQVAGVEKKGRVYASLVRFDPRSGECVLLSEMPVPHVGHVCVAHAGRVLVLAGITQDRSNVSAIHAYDPQTDRWCEIGRLESTRAICEGDVIGDTVYLPCGWSSLSRVPNPEFVACDLAGE
jgi:N-acetylneuraminic acid mutarotase